MKQIIILLLIVKLNYSQTLIQQYNSIPDYTKHQVMGNLISTGFSISIFKFTDNISLGCFGGTIIGASAGIFKEAIWDKRMNLGTCSNKDSWNTTWGSLQGGLQAGLFISIKLERDKKHENRKIHISNSSL